MGSARIIYIDRPAIRWVWLVVTGAALSGALGLAVVAGIARTESPKTALPIRDAGRSDRVEERRLSPIYTSGLGQPTVLAPSPQHAASPSDERVVQHDDPYDESKPSGVSFPSMQVQERVGEGDAESYR